jgi:hypothetical protein
MPKPSNRRTKGKPQRPVCNFAENAIISESKLFDFIQSIVMDSDRLFELSEYTLEECKSISSAAKLAEDAHKGQLRKGTDIPYIVHPFGVATRLLREGATPQMVIAGLLHDTVEDAGFSFQQIAQLYGDEVADIVNGCSEPDKSLSWRERKVHTIESLKSAPDGIRMVTCADKLDNINAIARDFRKIGENLWLRFNAGKERQRWYYQELVESLGVGKFARTNLFREFAEIVEDIFDTKNPWAEEPDLSEYHYYQHAGLFFRRKENAGYEEIDEVITSKGWTAYDGDRLAPALDGNKICEAEAIIAMLEIAKDAPHVTAGDEIIMKLAESLRANGLKLVDLG